MTRLVPITIPVGFLAVLMTCPPAAAQTARPTDGVEWRAKAMDEYLDLSLRIDIREGRVNPAKLDIAAYRKKELDWWASLPADQQKRMWRRMPVMLRRMHEQLDPLYVPPAVKAAAAKLPREARDEVRRLLSDDTDTYLAARRAVLARGPAARVPVADLIRKQAAGSDRQMRLKEVFGALEVQEADERLLRVMVAVQKRVAELGKGRAGKSGSKLTYLLAREVCGHRRADDYSNLCYFNFPKGTHDYGRGGEPAASLSFSFDHDDMLHFNFVGGQENSGKDLGPVSFADVRECPGAKGRSGWVKDRNSMDAVVGHVYLVHCSEKRPPVDMAVKFKVLDLRPSEWMVIEWEPVRVKE